ncbi:MAG: DUF2157 domain-containing protein [Ferruginibacter sp.]|nr:DUF2157 domain-containing protein [Ferruginibacter sp.]
MEMKHFHRLHEEGAISTASYEKILAAGNSRQLSVHWELKTLLYLGVLLLSSGLGILVYKNIDTIGHQVILLFLALVCAGSFYYCNRNKKPFSFAKVSSPNAWFDYILLLGCCTFITFVAYLQFQYQVFGNRYGLATFFPTIILFFSAYYFDHLGVLSMAVTSFAGWLGLTITPLHVLEANDFNNLRIIYTGLFLGSLLLLVAWLTAKRKFKAHFEFTYTNFGLHLLLISCLAAMFYYSGISLVWFLLIAGICYVYYLKATRDKSFYLLLVIAFYAYISFSYVFVQLISLGGSDAGIYLGFLYFIGSAIGMLVFLIMSHKKLKAL